MKTLSINVEWLLDVANAPRWSIVVDAIPPHSEHVYSRRGDLIYAESGGHVSFHAIGPEDAPGSRQMRGYGSAQFNFRMDTGETLTSTNVWSGCSGFINEAGFGPCLEAVLHPESNEWGCGIAAAVTLEWLVAELARLEAPFAIDASTSYLPPHTYYLPALPGLTWKQSKERLRAESLVKP